MIVFVLSIQVCWQVWNCEWRTVGSFVSESDCAEIGKEYALDETVKGFRCVVKLRVR